MSKHTRNNETGVKTNYRSYNIFARHHGKETARLNLLNSEERKINREITISILTRTYLIHSIYTIIKFKHVVFIIFSFLSFFFLYLHLSKHALYISHT